MFLQCLYGSWLLIGLFIHNHLFTSFKFFQRLELSLVFKLVLSFVKYNLCSRTRSQLATLWSTVRSRRSTICLLIDDTIKWLRSRSDDYFYFSACKRFVVQSNRKWYGAINITTNGGCNVTDR